MEEGEEDELSYGHEDNRHVAGYFTTPTLR
jgi:hypothetical protein